MKSCMKSSGNKELKSDRSRCLVFDRQGNRNRWIMKKKNLMLILLFSVAFITLGVVAFGFLPLAAPGLAWRTRCPYMQEMAIPHLMKRLHIGMTYDEMINVMGLPGETKRNIQKDGTESYSYNVNSWYNCGIDVTLKDGRITGVSEYNWANMAAGDAQLIVLQKGVHTWLTNHDNIRHRL